jgi:hypothetical protein
MKTTTGKMILLPEGTILTYRQIVSVEMIRDPIWL